MLENPERLRELVKETGAVNTDYQDPESVGRPLRPVRAICRELETYGRETVGGEPFVRNPVKSEGCQICQTRNPFAGTKRNVLWYNKKNN